MINRLNLSKTSKDLNKPLSLRKRKGVYQGEIVFDFLKNKKFFIICHTNSMQLETYLPIRDELKKIDFNLKFLKRKTILNYFDKSNKMSYSNNAISSQASSSFENIQNILNGSIAVIYPNNSNNVHIKIFDIVEKSSRGGGSGSNNKLIMLGFYLNDFYLISRGKKIFNKHSHLANSITVPQLTNNKTDINTSSIEFVSNILKISSIFLTLTSLLQKFNSVSQPWRKFSPQLIQRKTKKSEKK